MSTFSVTLDKIIYYHLLKICPFHRHEVIFQACFNSCLFITSTSAFPLPRSRVPAAMLVFFLFLKSFFCSSKTPWPPSFLPQGLCPSCSLSLELSPHSYSSPAPSSSSFACPFKGHFTERPYLTP